MEQTTEQKTVTELVAILNEPVKHASPNIETKTEVVKTKSIIADIDKLAKAVALSETKDCQLGYGKEYNNCFGIKNGSIAPCKEQGKNRMCIYKTPEDSYIAFKKIWTMGYGGKIPTIRHAMSWTGKDRAESWLKNVLYHYNK